MKIPWISQISAPQFSSTIETAKRNGKIATKSPIKWEQIVAKHIQLYDTHWALIKIRFWHNNGRISGSNSPWHAAIWDEECSQPAIRTTSHRHAYKIPETQNPKFHGDYLQSPAVEARPPPVCVKTFLLCQFRTTAPNYNKLSKSPAAISNKCSVFSLAVSDLPPLHTSCLLKSCELTILDQKFFKIQFKTSNYLIPSQAVQLIRKSAMISWNPFCRPLIITTLSLNNKAITAYEKLIKMQTWQ